MRSAPQPREIGHQRVPAGINHRIGQVERLLEVRLQVGGVPFAVGAREVDLGQQVLRGSLRGPAVVRLRHRQQVDRLVQVVDDDLVDAVLRLARGLGGDALGGVQVDGQAAELLHQLEVREGAQEVRLAQPRVLHGLRERAADGDLWAMVQHRVRAVDLGVPPTPEGIEEAPLAGVRRLVRVVVDPVLCAAGRYLVRGGPGIGAQLRQRVVRLAPAVEAAQARVDRGRRIREALRRVDVGRPQARHQLLTQVHTRDEPQGDRQCHDAREQSLHFDPIPFPVSDLVRT